MSKQNGDAAPEWITTEWLNVSTDLSLEALRGNVVAAVAFQMLCPGCVAQALPQMEAVKAAFESLGVIAVGLHSVFEHHEAMTPVALRAFLHEYRVSFPVGVDAPGEGNDPLPRTMRRYNMEGTPTLLLYDRQGVLRRQIFGHIADLRLGAEIMALVKDWDVANAPQADMPAGSRCST